MDNSTQDISTSRLGHIYMFLCLQENVGMVYSIWYVCCCFAAIIFDGHAGKLATKPHTILSPVGGFVDFYFFRFAD